VSTPRGRGRPVRSGLLRGRIGAGAALALAALIGLVIWLVVDSGSNNSSKPEGESVVTIVSANGMRTLAKALHQPIYWVGKRPGAKLELSQLPNGRLYVRYLPGDAKAGDRRKFLTVGTYPMQNAFSVVQTASKKQGAVPVAVAGGAALYHRDNRRSVYLAFPESNYQIEVYAPNGTLAESLVDANRVRSVTGASGTAKGPAVASVSAAELKALSARLGQPIYWVGSQPNVTYELTRTSNGRIFVRYLPAGAQAGARARYLTVGTYPVRNAYAITQRAATAGKGTTITRLSGGGIAVYKAKGSTHVYVAYRGSDYQIEVFSPTPGRARLLVAAESVSPVR
jgi:hypothetical protein